MQAIIYRCVMFSRIINFTAGVYGGQSHRGGIGHAIFERSQKTETTGLQYFLPPQDQRGRPGEAGNRCRIFPETADKRGEEKP